MGKVIFKNIVVFKRDKNSVSSSAKTAFKQDDAKEFKHVMQVLAKR